MLDWLKQDIDAVLARDPAAHSRIEVLMCYPGIRAVLYHRFAHRAYVRGHLLLARLISQRARHKTGVEIHPGAQLGAGFFIDHGSGVVIGETAVIGNSVTLYQGVTLGGTGKDTGKRHPTLGDGVIVGAGAKVLGPVTIGDRVKIGAGAVVLKDVPADCTVVGNPGRVVRRKQPVFGVDLDHGNLPDPVLERLDALFLRLTTLEEALHKELDRQTNTQKG